MTEMMTREYAFAFTRSEADGDGLTLEGYAAVFNSPTTINERGRSFTETVQPGAFKRSLNAGRPVLMFNHGQHPLIGDMPIGVITQAREDPKGLFIRARLAGNWLIEPVREAIANESVDGMSFRFETIRDKWSPDKTERTLQELRVAELGPVVFPAYAETSVSVRSIVQEIQEAAPEERHDLAVALLFEEVALRSEPAEGTSETDPPAPEPDPTRRATPDNSSKVERLKSLAKLKGYIS